MKNLYVVRTDIADFISPTSEYEPDEQESLYQMLLGSTGREDLSLPVIAITSSGIVAVPTNSLTSDGPRIKISDNPRRLAKLISNYREGNGIVYFKRTTPAKSIIDFTNGKYPLLNDALELLTGRYNLRESYFQDPSTNKN